MNNKLFKTGLAISSLGAVVAPVATAISCGSKNDSTKLVIIKSTWAKNGDQYKAMQSIVDYYNENERKNGDFKVKLIHVEGGYGDAVANDIKDIKNGNMDPVANLVIDYPDSSGRLLDYALDFSKVNGGKDIFTNIEGGITGNYVTQEVQGHDAGAFSIPLAKSTEMTSIDVPVMSYLLDNDFFTFDSSILGKAKELKDKIDAFKADSTRKNAEYVEIAKIWKTPSTLTPTTLSINTPKLNDDTLNEYDKLFQFSEDLAKKSGTTAEDTKHIVGHDSGANLFYQMYNARNGFNASEWLYKINSDKTFDYSKITTKSLVSDQNSLAGIAKTINDAVAKGGLVVNGGGAYSSSDFVKHLLPITIGSTAGYVHNFSNTSKLGIQLNGASDPYIMEKYDKVLIPKLPTSPADAIAVTNDKYKNPVYPSTFSGTVVKYGKKLASLTADQFVIDHINDADKKVALISTTTIAGADSDTFIKNAIGGKHPKDLIFGTTKKIVVTNDPASVGEDELLSLTSPLKTANTDSKKQILSQGPSFIGINHDEQKNIETIKFLKWFFGSRSKMHLDGGDISPVDYFDNNANYITPISGQFVPANKGKFSDGGNKVAFKAFSEIQSSNGISFENPVSNKSKVIREKLTTSIKSLYTDAHTGAQVIDSNLWDKLTKTLIPELT